MQAEIGPEGFISVASIPGVEEITMILCSVSKSHRMNGWSCGWVVAPKIMVENPASLNLCMSYGLPSFIQNATLVAIEIDHEIASLVKNKLDSNRGLFLEELSEMIDAKLYTNGAGMFAVMDVFQLGISLEDFAWRLLEKSCCCTVL